MPSMASTKSSYILRTRTGIWGFTTGTPRCAAMMADAKCLDRTPCQLPDEQRGEAADL